MRRQRLPPACRAIFIIYAATPLYYAAAFRCCYTRQKNEITSAHSQPPMPPAFVLLRDACAAACHYFDSLFTRCRHALIFLRRYATMMLRAISPCFSVSPCRYAAYIRTVIAAAEGWPRGIVTMLAGRHSMVLAASPLMLRLSCATTRMLYAIRYHFLMPCLPWLLI